MPLISGQLSLEKNVSYRRHFSSGHEVTDVSFFFSNSNKILGQLEFNFGLRQK